MPDVQEALRFNFSVAVCDGGGGSRYWHPQLQPSPRVHAWHPPFERKQLLPWIALASSYGCFFGLLQPIEPRDWQVWTGVYVAVTGVMLLLGLCATIVISPYVDPKGDRANLGEEKCPQCGLGRTSQSKTHHCSICNRCADGFDHREWRLFG